MTHRLVENVRLVIFALDGQYSMNEALERLRDAFEAHEQRDGFGEVCWSVDDVLGLRPNWTEAQARDFLTGVEGRIQDAMVEAGWYALEDLLSMEEYDPG